MKSLRGSKQVFRKLKSGLGLHYFKRFYMNRVKMMNEAVLHEVIKEEEKEPKVYLVKCSQQGQRLRSEKHVFSRRISRQVFSILAQARI